MWVKHQPWHVQSSDVPETELEWNMWRSRIRPYTELEAGDDVVTVGRGGTKAGQLLWIVRVQEVVKGAYSSHDEAWKLMQAGFTGQGLGGFKKRGFLQHEYTQSKPEHGWLLAFTSVPVVELNKPRPDGFRFRQNGWSEIESAEVR